MKLRTSLSMALIIIATFFVFIPTASAARLADAAFSKSLCNAWNNSSLPYRTGTEKERTYKGRTYEGSDWIHSMDQADGKQKIVTGRSDCKSIGFVELRIEKDAEGLAMCTGAGAYSGKGQTWRFLPSTANWFEFAKSFGMGAFYDLWDNGMVGSKTTAWGNRAHFGKFFKLAGRIGLKSDWETGCKVADREDVLEAIADLKK